MIATELAGEAVTLLPEKALHWPGGGTLFVADLHWGKAASFRAVGVAVPNGSIHADLDRLGRALAATAAARLVILGDLFHDLASKSAEVRDAVRDWRDARPDLEVLLVRGNHDRRSGDPPAGWGIRSESEPVAAGPFGCRHFPDPTPGLYTLAGHVHPSVTLRGAGRQRLRLPCFHFGPSVGILPAFGGFTGTVDVPVSAGDRVYVVADDEVLAVA